MANADKFFSDLQKSLEKGAEGIRQQAQRRIHQELVKELQDEDNIQIRTNREGTTVSEDADVADGPIDMKPFFRRSAKAKRKKLGGWYLTVPIRLYTPSKDPNKQKKANRMTNRLYKDLLNNDTTNRNLVSDYLYDKRQVSPIPELNYEPTTRNVTRLDNPRGRGSIYVAFRTVSDKSPVNSWIINRANARPDNLSNRIKRIIRQVRRSQG